VWTLESTKGLAVGQFVKSKAGRDHDRLYLILDIIDDNFVLLVDGNLRKIDSPKLKKVRHLVKINQISTAFSEALEAGIKPDDSLVKREIDKLQQV
jgi:ribosomal protein L14E/L6E/L27E